MTRPINRDPAKHYRPHCRTCRTKWTGQTVCHCGACHETFTSLSAFDAHRFNGICATIRENQGGNSAQLMRSDGKEMRLLRNTSNMWHYPGRVELTLEEALIVLSEEEYQ